MERARPVRRPTPTEGGPQEVAEQMAEALREAAPPGGREPERAHRRRRRFTRRRSTRRTGAVSQARNLPGWEGTFQLAEVAHRGARHAVRSATTSRSPPRPSTSSAPGAHYKSLLGVFWGTGVGGGVILDGKPWLGRGGAGEIGHMVVKRGGARAPAGAAAAWRPMRGAPRWRPKPAASTRRESKTELFKIMKKHDRDRLTSGIWEHALEAKDDRWPRS